MCGVELQFALYQEIYKLVSGYFSDAYLEIEEFEKTRSTKEKIGGTILEPFGSFEKILGRNNLTLTDV